MTDRTDPMLEACDALGHLAASPRTQRSLRAAALQDLAACLGRADDTQQPVVARLLRQARGRRHGSAATPPVVRPDVICDVSRGAADAALYQSLVRRAADDELSAQARRAVQAALVVLTRRPSHVNGHAATA